MSHPPPPLLLFQTLIEPAELLSHAGAQDWVIVDCRFSLREPAAGAEEYAAGHIPGAVYAHLDRDLSAPVVPGNTGRHPLPRPGVLEQKFRDWGVHATTQLVAYDASGGAFAARLWWLSRFLGHNGVCVLNGGLEAYQRAGGRLTTTQSQEPSDTRQGTFRAQVNASRVIDTAEVERWRQSAEHLLLDAREAERFRGEVEPIDPVAGRIPGAHSLPFTENLVDGRFKSPSQLRSRYQVALGDTPPEKAAVYCGSGVTACHNILAAAHAGVEGLKLYAGSYSEWITDPARAVMRGGD